MARTIGATLVLMLTLSLTSPALLETLGVRTPARQAARRAVTPHLALTAEETMTGVVQTVSRAAKETATEAPGARKSLKNGKPENFPDVK